MEAKGHVMVEAARSYTERQEADVLGPAPPLTVV